MSWFQENKFLGGFLIVTVVAAGGLGFLAMSASSKSAASEERYTALSGELSRLEGQVPFPSADNVKKMQGLEKAHEAEITALQTNLAKAEIPVEPLSPVGFQDLLKSSVDEVRAKAAAANVALPEKFYLGFPQYESTPPKDEVAAPLGRLLKAMKMVVMQLIEDKVAIISEINPSPLPGEDDKTPANDSGKKGGKGASGEKLVDRQPFEISFIGEERAFHTFVNQIVSNKTQFMIPKSIKVANEKLTGPAREFGFPQPPAFPPQSPPPGPGSPTTDAPGAPLPPDAPGTPFNPPGAPLPPGFGKEEKAKTFIVGDEKLQVTMVIEVVDFSAPASAEKKAVKKEAE